MTVGTVRGTGAQHHAAADAALQHHRPSGDHAALRTHTRRPAGRRAARRRADTLGLARGRARGRASPRVLMSARTASFTPGNIVSRRPRRTASCGRSSGASTGFRPTATTHSRAPARRLARALGRRGDARHARPSSRRRRHPTSTSRRPPDALSSTGEAGTLRFPSALATPHPENNIVVARWFPSTDDAAARRERRPRPRRRGAAAVELRRRRAHRPVAAAGALRRLGAAPQPALSRLRGCRPSSRAPTTSSARTSRARCRCAGRRCSTRGARWSGCRDQGFERIGILGTSLGSCLSLLTSAHEPLIRAQALNHVSPWFADVVWRGLSTRHVREGLDGHIDLERLRRLWRPISPCQLSRSRARHADAAGLRAIRPDVPGRSVEAAGRASSRDAVCRTRSRCCRAATTAADQRPSSSSMGTC